jgi:peptidoglycan/xylan/chitin deacetylase (PgdA/CDA1 family)
VNPTFALTLDTELIWGSFDHTDTATFARKYGDYRGTVRRILELLDRYEVPATWAVVGHLFLDECSRDERGRAHAEMAHPRQTGRAADWFADDPCTSLARDPWWYGVDILDAIQGSRIQHEIGSHSFSHPRFSDPAMTAQMVRSDLEACLSLAKKRGIALRSFVFPRNSEGHHELLREYGFRAYRGLEPAWHLKLTGGIGRAARLLDQVAGVAPPVSRPTERLPGLWNIPGSAFLSHRAGLRRAIPAASRVRKAKAGVRRAQATGGVFHLWTHPFNIASDPPYMVAILDQILRHVVGRRDAGKLVIEPMAAIAERAARERERDTSQ